MAKSILILNPVTVDLVNQVAKLVGKTPTNTADWYLQQTLRNELLERANENTRPVSKQNIVSKQASSVDA